MATGKLIGADDATADTVLGAEYIGIDKFQCSASGSCTEIRIKVDVNSNVKAAIYADSSGPAGRLAKQDTGKACTAGWNTITLEVPVSLTNGTYYWLAIVSDTQILSYVHTAGSGHKVKAVTYSGFTWPDPAGTGFTTADAYYGLFAGFGFLVVSPSGISQATALGTPKLNFTLYPSGISQALAYGTPVVQVGGYINPPGIEQLVALGTPTITLMLQFISPTGIAQPIVIGTPALIYPQTLSPQGIAQAIVFGTPSVGIYGRICPAGIAQLVAIGSPTLLKYVWHIILDGQYATETLGVNRAYIIGRDQYDNPVYGTAVDSTELALVGERLDFIPDPAIPTTAQAGDVASAVLAKMRLMGKRGVILIPPNCGQELFDVVQVSDSMANQSAVTFRVVGIRFEYNPKQARYQHKLILGAP